MNGTKDGWSQSGITHWFVVMLRIPVIQCLLIDKSLTSDDILGNPPFCFSK